MGKLVLECETTITSLLVTIFRYVDMREEDIKTRCRVVRNSGTWHLYLVSYR